MNKVLFYLLTILSFTACKKEDKTDYSQVDKEIIEKYISDHNLNAQSTSSGLYYVIEDEGNGARPTSSSSVNVIYKGYLTNGKVFDESGPFGASFKLSQVIKGWQEGIPLFKEGGKGKLLIPSELAYGSNAPGGGIPAHAVLIFDIELTAVL